MHGNLQPVITGVSQSRARQQAIFALWGRMESCGRLVIGLLCGDVQLAGSQAASQPHKLKVRHAG
jgi:hypothetical protein